MDVFVLQRGWWRTCVWVWIQPIVIMSGTCLLRARLVELVPVKPNHPCRYSAAISVTLLSYTSGPMTEFSSYRFSQQQVLSAVIEKMEENAEKLWSSQSLCYATQSKCLAGLPRCYCRLRILLEKEIYPRSPNGLNAMSLVNVILLLICSCLKILFHVSVM